MVKWNEESHDAAQRTVIGKLMLKKPRDGTTFEGLEYKEGGAYSRWMILDDSDGSLLLTQLWPVGISDPVERGCLEEYEIMTDCYGFWNHEWNYVWFYL